MKRMKNCENNSKFDAWVEESSKPRQSSLLKFFHVSAKTKNESLIRKRPRMSVGRTPPSPKALMDLQTPPSAATRPIGANGTPPTPVEILSHRESSSSDISSGVQKVRNTAKKPRQQMYLDLGQRSFGKRNICSICGMLYVAGLEEDTKQHKRVCKEYKQGVPFQASNARVVANFGKNASIIEVRPSDSSPIRKKVLQVRVIVDKELGFAPASDECKVRSTYLYLMNRRVVGMLSAELIERGYTLHTNFERSKEPQKAMLGVHQLWVHSKFRNQHIASRLLDVAREKMIFGLVVPAESVAFSSPTEAGIAFARSYLRRKLITNQVLVYDCH